MNLIVFGQEDDYKKCVDRSHEYFRSLPQDQVQYVDDQYHTHDLVRFIFTGPMAVKMYSYACNILPLKMLYCQEKPFEKNENMIGYLEAVKNLIERGRVEFNVFHSKPLVFCTSLHSIHRLTATACIMFKSYEKRFIHDNSGHVNRDHFDFEMDKIKSYLSALTDKSNNEV